jgi:hypothetical protein
VSGSGYVDPRILDLGTRWRWMVRFTPRPLYPEDCPSSIPGTGKWCLYSAAQPASYPIVPGAVKRSGRDADHSPPHTAAVKNGGAPPTLPIRFHCVMLNWLSTGGNFAAFTNND